MMSYARIAGLIKDAWDAQDKTVGYETAGYPLRYGKGVRVGLLESYIRTVLPWGIGDRY
ncbi:hypothetical protein D3C84_1001400 [compost metagenome]